MYPISKLARSYSRRGERRASRLAGMSLVLIALIVGAGFPTLATHQPSDAGAAVSMPPPESSATNTRRRAVEAFGHLPLRFEACGPAASGPFLARAGDCNLYLTATEAVLGWPSPGDAGRLGRGADLGSPRNAGSLDANEQLPGPRRDRAAPRPRRSPTDKSLDDWPV